MSHPKSKTRLIALLLAPLIISLACSPSRSATPAAPAPAPANWSVEQALAYGSGPFNLPSTKVGLSNLTSYIATLSLSFDGTSGGQPAKWTATHVMRVQRDQARLFSLEKSGDLPDLDALLMAEEGGMAFERVGDGLCRANPIEAGNTLNERMEPAGLLYYVIGANNAGTETVNDIASDHYTFDQQALGQPGITESSGEMWIAAEGGHVVKYLLTSTGKSDYFGADFEGTLKMDYELTDVNQPAQIVIPPDCPPGFVGAPQLPDASNVESYLGSLSYQTASSVPDAAAFYQSGLPNLGWQVTGDPAISDESGLLTFSKAGQAMSVLLTAETSATTVQIVLLRTEE